MTLTAGTAAARVTTGRLVGVVVDDDGTPLAGATVTVSSPALIGGEQSNVTDPQGGFAFIGIAPGEYTVKAELAGFTPQERARVKVSLGHAVSLTIPMPKATFSGQVEVRDETPVVDPAQVSSGQVFDQDYMQGSAIGSANRNYLVIVNQAAGVTGGSWGGVPQSKVLGSTIGENAYIIDGVDATDPVTATAKATMIFDTISEIQFLTGGFEAEHGRATGGIINVVTKSGGNRFSGAFDLRYGGDSFSESGTHFDSAAADTSFQQYSITLGGPILRDKLWFFAGYGRTIDEFTPVASPTTREETRQSFLLKTTWQIGPGWRLTGKYSADPRATDNYNASRWTMPEATVFFGGETQVLSGELNSVLSDSLLWNSTVGLYHYDSELYPQSGELQTIGHYNYDTGLSTHNAGSQLYWGSRRRDLTTDFTWFVDGPTGSHEFKVGVEYSHLAFPDEGFCSTGTPNGERCVEGVSGFFFYDIEDEPAAPYFMEEWQGYTEAEYKGAISSAFVQDAWRVTRTVTLKLGMRYDWVTYDNNAGTRVADMGVLQPRLGFAWDLTGDAKTLLRGSWGRHMHPNALTLPSFASTNTTSGATWYSCTRAVPEILGIPVASAEECAAAAADLGNGYRLDHEGWDPFGWMLPPGASYGEGGGLIAAGLRAPYADELVVAFEREVARRSSVELTYVNKKTRDIFDDTCNGNIPDPIPGADCEFFVWINIPELRRDYQGLLVRYETRSLNWLTLLASYAYSISEGSVGYNQNTGVIANVYPWHFDNLYGYLNDHRRHRLKLNGFVNFKGDWTIAFDGFWSSPFTWTPFENRGNNWEIPYGRHLLEPRGNREANSNYQLDLQLSKGFSLNRVRMVLIASVYNVFSNEQPVSVCEWISGCGALEMGDPIGWQTPRRYEVGFRVEF